MMTNSFRLSENVVPINYELFFDVDMDNFHFIGKEIIDMEIKKPTKEIILHATDMKIGNISLVSGKKTIKPKIKFESEKEKLTLTFNEKIKGKAKLQIDF